MRKWIKLDRLSAWVLLFCMLIYTITGFGMVKGFISYQFASKIHLDLLSVPLAIAFIIHTGFATRLALIRWKIWPSYGKYIWAIFYILIIGGFIFVDRLYSKPMVTVPSANTTVPVSTITAISSQSTAKSKALMQSPIFTLQKTFTLEQLAKYNGENGQSAYVAVDGNVYDLTSVFRNGNHQGYSAGQDLTTAFHAQHNTSTLSSFTIVGKLVN